MSLQSETIVQEDEIPFKTRGGYPVFSFSFGLAGPSCSVDPMPLHRVFSNKLSMAQLSTSQVCMAPVAAGPFRSLCGLDQAAASRPLRDGLWHHHGKLGLQALMRQLEKPETDCGSEPLELSICEAFAKIQIISKYF